jgi:hypothetical protein
VPDPAVKHPEHSSSLLGRIWFSWVTPLIRQGARAPLQHRDLFPLPEQESATYLHKMYWKSAAYQWRSNATNATSSTQLSPSTSTSKPTNGSAGAASCSSTGGNNNRYGIEDAAIAEDASKAESMMTTSSFFWAMFRLVRVPFFTSGFFQLVYVVSQVTHRCKSNSSVTDALAQQSSYVQ